jgi:hypothetical protein
MSTLNARNFKNPDATGNSFILDTDGSVIVSGAFVTNAPLEPKANIVFKPSGSSSGVTIKPPSTLVSGIEFSLPNAYGGSGEIIKTDSSGNLGWKKSAYYEEFSSAGSWSKPVDVQYVLVEAWGAGGAGAPGTTGPESSTINAGFGGGGGAYNTRLFTTDELPPSVFIAVGAGGIASGENGGDSSFGTYLTGYGGSAGALVTSLGGGGGGGRLSAGSGTLAGEPRETGLATANIFGGGAGSGAVPEGSILGGGAGARELTGTSSGFSVYGGAGGTRGAIYNNSSGYFLSSNFSSPTGYFGSAGSGGTSFALVRNRFDFVAYHSGEFLLGQVSGAFLGCLLSSTDGSTWNIEKLDNPFLNIDKIFHDGSQWVGYATRGGIIYVSINKKTWIQKASLGFNELNSMAYYSGLYVAVGGQNIRTSTDLENWTIATGFASQVTLLYVIHDNNNWLVTSSRSTLTNLTAIYISNDAQSWTARTPFSGIAGASGFFTRIASDQTTLVVYSPNAPANARVLYSTDTGVTWATGTSPSGWPSGVATTYAGDLKYRNGTFVLTPASSPFVIHYSTNGQTFSVTSGNISGGSIEYASGGIEKFFLLSNSTGELGRLWDVTGTITGTTTLISVPVTGENGQPGSSGAIACGGGGGAAAVTGVWGTPSGGSGGPGGPGLVRVYAW